MAASVAVEPHGMSLSQGPSLDQSIEYITEEPAAIQGSIEAQESEINPQTRRDRVLRKKKRKQQQFQRAFTSMMESFQSIFEDSDADISDLDDRDPRAREAAAEEAYSTPLSDDNSESLSPSRDRARRSDYYQGSADGRSPDARETDDRPQNGRLSRRPTVLEEVEPGPISFETELYEYSRSRGNDYDEPLMVGLTVTPAPHKISKLGTHAGSAGTNGEDHIFKVVSMYSVPRQETDRDRKLYQSSQRRSYPRRDSYDVEDANIVEKSTYRRGRPVRPISVTASVGSYLVIYSEVIMRAIRRCVRAYPGISGAIEFMSIPAPYTLIVHYRGELQAYSDEIPDGLDMIQDELPSPTTDRNDGNQESQRPTIGLPLKQHIPLLLNHVFSLEFTATYDHEMSLRKKPVPMCTYALAWMLFRPGTMVYALSGNSLDAYVVEWCELEGLYSGDSERRKRSRGLAELVRPPQALPGEVPEYSSIPKSLVVKLHYLEYDGTRIGRRRKIVTITPFEGEQEISSLPVYPIEYAQDPTLRETLITRGQKYFRLCERHYMSYSGDTIATVNTPSRKVSFFPFIVASTISTCTDRLMAGS